MRLRMVHAQGWYRHLPTTIGQIIEPPDAAPASAVKSTGIFILARNLGGGLPSGSVVYIPGDPKSMSEIFCTSLRRHAKT
jgi:hypothetical protein